MSCRRTWLVWSVLGLLAGANAEADDLRARQNYQLHCMGCHGESGEGLEGHVPSLRGTFARIAVTPAGRDYVLRVPGVTQTNLEPARVAEMLNWLLREFSSAEAARSVRPFTPVEVAAARERPLLEAGAARRALLTSDH